MRLSYLGHSCFLLEENSTRLLFDPNLSENPALPAGVSIASLHCDYILVSHGHEDHCCDALALAQEHGATIIANFELAEYWAAKGARTHGLNPGGGFAFPFGRVQLTPARHSSSFSAGLSPVYMGEACGILVELGGKRIYHAGDTGLFLDMGLIARRGLDLALLPIGDNFTMGPEDALDALDLLKPKLCVPMHYNTWPLIKQDGEAFAKQAEKRAHLVRALRPGDCLEL